MPTSEQLVYVTPSVIAHRLGVGRSAVANWVARETDGMPMPDAYLEGNRSELTPIWSADRAEEVVTWALDRMRRAADDADRRAAAMRERVRVASSA